MEDPVLINDWHAVAKADELAVGDLLPVELLDNEIVLWRSHTKLHAWLDRCPHRGTKLSLGAVRDDCALVCPYHGWQFDDAGQCISIPAQPDMTPSEQVHATVYPVRESYGLIWVSLGTPERDVPEFHGVDSSYRLVVAGPYDVETSGPRAVENFLDLSHFPFVHRGYLGEEPYTEIDSYDVKLVGDEIHVSNASAYQPRANVSSTEAAKVAYSYRVMRPMTAMLAKESGTEIGKPSDLILLAIQPKSEVRVRAFFVLAMNYGRDQPDRYFQDFQDTVFLQDKAILESQKPKRVPLEPTDEMHQRADRTSVVYRRWLREKGVRFGTL